MTGSPDSPIRLDIDGGVARLTVDRPSAANTIDLPAAVAFHDAIDAVSAAGCRAVIITGAGAAFCAGGDVAAMSLTADPANFLRELADTFHAGLRALAALDAVVIAAVNGAAAGGGLGLALHADVVLAAPTARFLTAYEQLGLTPDSGVSALLPQSIGLHRALAMIATGRPLDAATAYEHGLVHEVVPADELLSRAGQLAARIARHPQSHMSATRRLLHAGSGAVDHRLDDEAQTIAALASTDVAAERIHAFGADRKDAAR